MMNFIPSNYTSLEILAQAELENPNPSPTLAALFKRCHKELSSKQPDEGSRWAPKNHDRIRQTHKV